MPQCEGTMGWVVERMIRRSLRRSFHNIYWRPPERPISTPSIVCANHNGWFDGYVMFAALTALGAPFLLWMEEYGAFPPFGKCGAMPFPVGDAGARAATIRGTIRRMCTGERSLLLFPEGVLHPPGDLLPFGRSLQLVADRVENAKVVPVAIRYQISMHERPECFVLFGQEVERGAGLAERTREAVARLQAKSEEQMAAQLGSCELLAKGTPDINERMDFRGRNRKPSG